MLRTFNCGIGMVLVVDPGSARSAMQCLEQLGETACVLGKLEESADGEVRFAGRLAL
jgi:phosphoribosylformylglycinamidine cyclo-ligase